MADGIKLDGLELQADFASSGYIFHFQRGGLQSLPTFRGEDDVIPEAAGREPGEYIADSLEIVLHGFIAGAGATAQARRESFRTRAAALIAKMDPSTLVDLVVYPPNFGLATGQTATITNVRPLRIGGPDPSVLGYEGWEVTLEFTTTDDVTWEVQNGS